MDRFLNDDSPAAKVAVEVLRNYEGLFQQEFLSVSICWQEKQDWNRVSSRKYWAICEMSVSIMSLPEKTPDHL